MPQQKKAKKALARRSSGRVSAKGKITEVTPKKAASRRGPQRRGTGQAGGNPGSTKRAQREGPSGQENARQREGPGFGERMDEGFRMHQEGQEGSSVPMRDVLEAQERHHAGSPSKAQRIKQQIDEPLEDSSEGTTELSGDV